MTAVVAQTTAASALPAILAGAGAWTVTMICAWWFPPPPDDWPAWPAYALFGALTVLAGVGLCAHSPAARWLVLAAAIAANGALWIARRPTDDDDDGGIDRTTPTPDDPGGDSVDWDAFDRARRDWARPRTLA